MIIDTARVVGSGSPCLTAHRCLASAAPVRQCVHRPSLESERQAVSRKPIANDLGQVYEQFLGKVIRLTAGHQAKVEEKPEVRKAGGVYYRPTYIVDYIVKNTVGKLLEARPPAATLTSRGGDGIIRALTGWAWVSRDPRPGWCKAI